MLYLLLYFLGIITMLAIHLLVQHKHRQYYKYIVYMTLVISGAYKFSSTLLTGQEFFYTIFLTITMCVVAAYISRLAIGPNSTNKQFK